MGPTPQDIQLMSKNRVLGFKPQLRREWRGQDGQNGTEQPDHSTSLGDSITASTQIRFSVHTHTRGVPQAAVSRSKSDDWETAHANARRELTETIQDQLQKLIRDRDEPGETAFHVDVAAAAAKRSFGNLTVGLTDSIELRRSRNDGDRRAWALAYVR
jgi:hypothetical protein